MIPASVQEAMNKAQKTLMPGLCNVEQATLTSDEEGGYTTEWTPIAKGCHLRLMPGGSGINLQQPIVERLGTRVGYIATVSANVNIDVSDRIHQTFPQDRIFDIVGILNDRVSLRTAWRLVIAESL